MKKLISITLLLILTSCTAPQEASTIGSDAAVYNMNTVKDYNSRIISANTVSTQEKIKLEWDIVIIVGNNINRTFLMCGFFL